MKKVRSFTDPCAIVDTLNSTQDTSRSFHIGSAKDASRIAASEQGRLLLEANFAKSPLNDQNDANMNVNSPLSSPSESDNIVFAQDPFDVVLGLDNNSNISRASEASHAELFEYPEILKDIMPPRTDATLSGNDSEEYPEESDTFFQMDDI